MTRRSLALAACLAGLLVAACATSPVPATEPTANPEEVPVQDVSQPESPAAAVAVIQLRVESFDAWKAVFDEHGGARGRAGILSAHVSRSTEDPHGVTVCLTAGSFEALQTFLDSPDRARAMQRGGVIGAPVTTLLVPVEDQVVKDKPLAGAVVRIRVADFEVWKRGFDARASVRAEAGIVGYAIDRAKDDANEVVVYLQAETTDALRRFTDSDDLRAAMAKGGVEGRPSVALVQSFAVSP